MRIVLLWVLMLCLLAIFSQVAGQESVEGQAGPGAKTKLAATAESVKFDFWMNVKLVESQKLFAALAQADFETLAESSQTLKTVSALEGFVRRRTPEYRTQLKSFEFSVNEILQQAAKENIEGVTLGFQQLTMSCVNCHKQLRQ